MEREKGSTNNQVQEAKKKKKTGDFDGEDNYDDDDSDDEDVQSLRCNKYFSEDKWERNGCIAESVSTGTPRSVVLMAWQCQS